MSTPSLSIGEFSRITHLSAKALRFYHREGLLEPAAIDPGNGYREYTLEQLPTAQVIRRFRALDVPVDTVREVLQTSDPVKRNALIAEHLERMELQLESVQAAVGSLRDLLVPASAEGAPVSIERRSVAAIEVLRIDGEIDLDELGTWYTDAFHELDEGVARSGWPVSGARGGLWSTELFRDEHGPVSVFRPVVPDGSLAKPRRAPERAGRARLGVLPAADYAVTVHSGPDSEIDRSYGALGAYVARHELSVDGPVRESYLVSEFDDPHRERVTEIAWPIFRTAP
jgi:DNA-binding transcriptional MerR regulator